MVALATALALLAVPMPCAYADSGTVYSCEVVPCYRHPVTGVIEDAGGEAGYATGLGMVESCIFSRGMMEVTDAGAYYLTIRVGLLDYSSGHTFQVQEWGASGWSDPRLGVTGTGSDSSGATEDVCIEVPSQKCVVRMTMFVEPMGRDVICYCYPKDFTAGQPTGMNATMVTASTSAGVASAADAAGTPTQGSGTEEAASQAADDGNPTESPGEVAASELESVDDTATDGAGEADAEELTGQGISQAQGLTLSTATVTAGSAPFGESFQLDLPEPLVMGLASAAGAACVFVIGAIILFAVMRRRSWYGADPDDYYNLYGDTDA